MGIADSTFRGAATRYLESLKKKDRCNFCDKEALYTQPHEDKIIDVCRKHFSMGLTS